MGPVEGRKAGGGRAREPQAGSVFKVEVLKKSLSFAHLCEDDLKKLAAHATIRYFCRKEFVFHDGDPAGHLCVVQFGRVKLFKVSASGKEFVAHIAGPGNTLNVAALFWEKPHYLSAQCIEDTSVLLVGREEFLAFVNEFPSVAIKTIGMLGEVTKLAYEKIIDLLVEKVDLRVCTALFMLSSKFGTILNLTSSDIADIAGTTTASTIRAMSRLRKVGILRTHRQRITILDQAKLGKLSRSLVGEDIFNYF